MLNIIYLIFFGSCIAVIDATCYAPPLVCKENEVLNPCPKPCVPGEMSYCYEYIRGEANECIPPATLPCEPRCDCIAGYLRKEGKCVKKEDCCEGPNEIVVECPDPCPLSCDNLLTHGQFPCMKACPKSGCACKDGFVRNATNVCVPIAQCPNPCKIKNEVLNPCPGYCTFDDDCPTLLSGLIRDCAAPPPDYKCAPRCECKRNFVRIDTRCETVDKCCKGPNEVITDCPAPCDETCNGKPSPDCQLSPCFRKGCRCKNGYVRNAKGNCILKSQCRSCKKPNEIYKDCGTACEPTCDDRSPVCTEQCVPGCFCKENFIRKVKDGECIPISSCPSKCTGANEEYKMGTCDPTCDMPIPMCRKAVTLGCYCREGFVRQNGVCIDKNLCPPKCGENEEYSSCGSCDPSCDNPNPICTAVCRKGCFCQKGFVRDANGKCIDPQTCPKKCTGANEEYKMGTCDPTCDIPIPNCKKGPTLDCYCKEGFVRQNGVCIDKKTCPIKCTDPNEEYKMGTCNPTCEMPIPQCKVMNHMGCFCKDGFVKDKNGVCIDKKTCPKECPGPNEEYKMGTCDFTCEIRVPHCKVVDHLGCFCKDGFVRHKDNVCIDVNTCPKKCDRENEIYSDCGPCDPSCDNRNPVCVAACIPGCICKPGFVRDANQKCIDPKLCPVKECKGPNEIYTDCGTCDPSCKNRNPICAQVCRSGCFCKPGFVRNDKGICVSPTACPKC